MSMNVNRTAAATMARLAGDDFSRDCLISNTVYVYVKPTHRNSGHTCSWGRNFAGAIVVNFPMHAALTFLTPSSPSSPAPLASAVALPLAVEFDLALAREDGFDESSVTSGRHRASAIISSWAAGECRMTCRH